MSEHAERTGSRYYDELVEEVRRHGEERLGLMTSWAWYDDPRRLAFTLSRYKFVAKMIEGVDRALEVGCGDGFGSRVVAQAVNNLTAIDFDEDFIASARATASDRHSVTFHVHDILRQPVEGRFDAVYSMDVLEHIPVSKEDQFVTNAIAPLHAQGICIIGTPSLESQAYASKYSKLGHVNCKAQPVLKALLARYFHNVFAFSMNDEVVHTGFSHMSHYNLVLACGKKTG